MDSRRPGWPRASFAKRNDALPLERDQPHPSRPGRSAARELPASYAAVFQAPPPGGPAGDPRRLPPGLADPPLDQLRDPAPSLAASLPRPLLRQRLLRPRGHRPAGLANRPPLLPPGPAPRVSRRGEGRMADHGVPGLLAPAVLPPGGNRAAPRPRPGRAAHPRCDPEPVPGGPAGQGLPGAARARVFGRISSTARGRTGRSSTEPPASASGGNCRRAPTAGRSSSVCSSASASSWTSARAERPDPPLGPDKVGLTVIRPGPVG